MLPGGRAVLFTILAIDKPPRAAVHLLESGETRSLFEGIGARFVGSGHVVFGRQERLWAVGFDRDSLQTLGAPRPVRDDVLWLADGYPQFAVDADLLAYVRTSQASSHPRNSVLTWVDRQGRKTPLTLKANDFMLPRLSPAGDRLVVQVGATRDLWTYDFSRGTLTKLTSDRIIAFSAPAWTPDGSRVAFTTWFDGDVGLGWLSPDGSGRLEELIKGIGMRSFERTHPVMLPDGSGLIMTGLAPGRSVEGSLFVPLIEETQPCFRLQVSSGTPRWLRAVVSSLTTRTNRAVVRCTCARSQLPAPESGQSPPTAAQVRCGPAVGASLSTRTAKAA